MTVAALLIIRDDHVRTMLTYNRHELAQHLIHAGLGESLGRRVGLPAMHPRVVVAEGVEMRHPRMDAACCSRRDAPRRGADGPPDMHVLQRRRGP